MWVVPDVLFAFGVGAKVGLVVCVLGVSAVAPVVPAAWSVTTAASASCSLRASAGEVTIPVVATVAVAIRALRTTRRSWSVRRCSQGRTFLPCEGLVPESRRCL